MSKTVKPFGTWPSPISADLITQKAISIAEIVVDAATHAIYHVEARPAEAGRNVLVYTTDEKDVVDKEWNVRTAVQEYGGAPVAIRAGHIYFSDMKSGRVHKIDSKDGPVPVTPESKNHRFADFDIHPNYPHLVLSILEDHTKPEPANAVTSLVVINAKTKTFETIAKGADFYASAKFSPDGKKVAWIQWHHPDMPWEGSELAIAEFYVDPAQESFKSVSGEKVVAGQPEKESTSQPNWLSDDKLLFLSDSSGFYNPHVYDFAKSSASPALASPLAQDFAEPAWLLGGSSLAVLTPTSVVVCPVENGTSYLAILDLKEGTINRLKTPYQTIGKLHACDSTHVVFTGLSDTESSSIIELALSPEPTYKTLKQSSTIAATLPEGSLSRSIPYELGTSDAPLYVTFYGPLHPEYRGLEKELPPAVISVHGGPTSRVPPGLAWTTQYFTSRGWAWIDVQYGGSSGYGRAYRERLRGNWGIVDVDDCVSAVEELSKRGLIDQERTAIRGGSAGGYTVLASLVTKPTVFRAATSSYGVSDLAKLAEDTHKFESRYLEKLVGGTFEEVPDLYKERSPVYHAEKIKTPLLILQGSIDAVVPPNQAEAILEKVKANGGRVEYVLFEGEGHGWRKAENVKRALETELAFYEDVFGLRS